MLLMDIRIRRYFWPAIIGLTILYWIHHVFMQRTDKPTDELGSDSMPVASVIINGKAERHFPKGEIPKIIHQTWKSHHIPQLMIPWVKSWLKLNPDWEYWFWTDQDIAKFVKARFPQQLDLFNSYPEPGYRADAFRYMLLLDYGGVYADLDMEAVRPLDPLLDQYRCLLSQEPQEHAHFLSPMGIPLVSNALMMCRPGHRFFQHVVDDLKDYAGFFKWNSILKATGPYMLTEIYKGYSRPGLIFSAPSGDDKVDLADPEVFQPTTDQSMRDHMREACIHSQGHDFLSGSYLAWQDKLCNRILKQGFSDGPAEGSYTNHHWTHTWGGRHADPWNVYNNPQTFDVRTLKVVSK